MMKLTIFCMCLTALVAMTSAHEDIEHIPPYPPGYNFDYKVVDDKTHNFFGHRERKDNDGVVRGEYFVLLPDGRTQIVDYSVCKKSGYQATVKYVRKDHFHHH